MNRPSEDTFKVRLLRRLAAAVYRHRGWLPYAHLLLLLGSVAYTVTQLEFDTDRANLVGANQQYHRNFTAYLAEFEAADDLVAVVESEDAEKNRQFVERLGSRLEAETNLFKNVFYKGDLKVMGSKALLFVPDDAVLEEMLARLRESRPVLDMFSQVTNLTSLFQVVNRQFRAALLNQGPETEALIEALPALGRMADQAADAIDRPGQPPSPGVTALFDPGAEAEQQLYITFATNRIYLVTAKPTTQGNFEASVEKMRALVEETRVEVPGVNAGITGEPVLEVDEMAQSRRDMIRATVTSLFLCSLLFIYAYRQTGRPLKAVATLVFGLGYTMGFATLAVGHLNILTVTFLPILVGLAIDFGIHLVTRYEEETRQGRSDREAIEIALVNTGQGILTGCFTTAGAFLAMGFTDFKGIREMGVICGGGLLICLFPMFTLLPALLLRGRQNQLDQAAVAAIDSRARLENLWLKRPGLVTLLTIGLTVLALYRFPRVYFDYNLLHLQSKGLPAVEYEHKLIDAASKSVLFGAIIADSIEEAVALQSRVETLPSVASVDSMADYMAQDQTRKLAIIGQIKHEVADLEFADPDPDTVNLSELLQTLQVLHAYLGLGTRGASREGEIELSSELHSVRESIARLRRTAARSDRGLAARKLTAFQDALLADLRQTFVSIRSQDNSAPLRQEDLPTALRQRFVGVSGNKYLLQVSPKRDVWERKNQEEFVAELRSVDPDVTGAPVQLLEYTGLLKDSYIQAAWYSLGAIVILLFIHFRQVPAVLLALVPVALGTVWMTGAMAWLGVPFNPANIMTLPLVIGVGVTNGIHILNRCAEEGRARIFARSTGKAVLLSALTTMTGFGSLMAAKHQGIASLGLVMAMGTGACMLAGLTFLPTLLNWLSERGWIGFGKKKPSSDNAGSPLGSGGTEAKL